MSVEVASYLRDTDNPLLIKAEIGQPLKRGFTLPPTNFTYGKSSQGKMSGCAEALGTWNTKLAPLQVKDMKRPQRDFISLNKAATSAGLITSQEHFQYRATHDVLKDNSSILGGKNTNPIKRLPPTMVHGMPTKPSTPVFDLLEHRYQDRWLKEQRKSELAKQHKEDERKKSSTAKSYYETRACRLRRFSPPVDSSPLWQMPRFQKVAPKLETFRGEDARRKAFKHHTSDCTSRTGVFGHGIYEGAKS